MQQPERGCLPCCNCLVTVPQDKWYAAEMFGSFKSLHGPGLSWVGCDVCGVCITLRSITSRVEQLLVMVPTKTQDNVFVEVVVAVQFSVNPQSANDAFYKLSDVGAQIDSYVSDVVRSQIPKMPLDDTFENKDRISVAVQEDLSSHMAGFGFQIHKALVTDISVSREVMQSMNEINKQKRLRDASIMAAEAEKIRVVKAAEADADAACLVGEGIARQRSAIVQGLRDSVSQTGRDISTNDVTELLLVTQYFETLRDIGSHDNCKAYFLPDNDGDVDSQVRQGMLEGQAALEFLRSGGVGGGGGGGGGGGRPRQQQMTSNGGYSSPSPPPEPQRYTPPPEPQQYTPPPEPQRYTPPPPPPRQPSFRPEPQPRPQPVVQQPRPLVMQVQVPAGVGPGAQLQVQAPDGRVVMVQVPPGVRPGQVLQIQV